LAAALGAFLIVSADVDLTSRARSASAPAASGLHHPGHACSSVSRHCGACDLICRNGSLSAAPALPCRRWHAGRTLSPRRRRLRSLP